MSGGYESNFVPRKEVTISDTQPVNPKEGDWWFDSSSEQMKYYNGSSWIVPGNKIDNETIKTNSSDELIANIDGKTIFLDSNGEIGTAEEQSIIGDFESNFGGWNLVDNSGLNNGRTTEQAHKGSYSVNAYDTDILENTSLNLNNISKLIVWVWVYNDSPDFIVYIDGSQVASVDVSDDQAWNKAVIDVGDYSGDVHLELEAKTQIFFDDIRTVKGHQEKTTVNSTEAGN